MANMRKLEAALDHIRTHPEQHDQGYWGRETACGTTMCMAGTVAHLAGYELFWDRNSTGHTSLCQVPQDYPNSYNWFNEGRVAFIKTIAQQELELTHDQADELFYKAESLDDLERVVKDIANEQSWDKC